MPLQEQDGHASRVVSVHFFVLVETTWSVELYEDEPDETAAEIARRAIDRLRFEARYSEGAELSQAAVLVVE